MTNQQPCPEHNDDCGGDHRGRTVLVGLCCGHVVSRHDSFGTCQLCGDCPGWLPPPTGMNLAMHEQIDRRRTHTLDGVQTWAQVGWLGQTGRVYDTHTNPAETEPGGFAPLWLLLEDESPEPDLEEGP